MLRDLEPSLLPEYAELFELWPTPDDLRRAVLAGEQCDFSTFEHVEMAWGVVRTDQGEVELHARAWPTYGLVDLLVTAWWNTAGRDIPKPLDDPAGAMRAAMASLLALVEADSRVTPVVDPDAEDGIDAWFSFDCQLRPGLAWNDVHELLNPLARMGLVEGLSSFPGDKAAAVLQRHGFLLFRCSNCDKIVTDRMPGWPSGMWLSTEEGAEAVCDQRLSSSTLVERAPLPHVGEPWLFDGSSAAGGTGRPT